MLLIDNKELLLGPDESVVLAATSNTHVREANAAFLSRGDLTTRQLRKKCVHVLQNETASVEYQVDDAVVASDDATTCVIVVVVCQATGVVSIAHLDEQTSKSDACFRKLMSHHLGGRHCTYDAYVVGGMVEDTLVGLRTSSSLLDHMVKSPGRFNLRLCCVSSENTCERTGQPLARSFAFDPLPQSTYHVSAPTSREAGPATAAAAVPLIQVCKGKRPNRDCGAVPPLLATPAADQRGPGLEQRLAQYWLNDHGEGFADLATVYDTWDQKYVLAGRMCTVPRWLMVSYSYLLTLSDAELLEKTSTTPRYEGENFCLDVRMALGFILKQQEVFTIHTRSFVWDPVGRMWMEVSSDKKLRRGEGATTSCLEEPKVDIPGSSWSYTSLVDLEKEHLAAAATQT